MTTASATFSKSEFLSGLVHFTGSDTFYRHGLVRSVVFTEGAHQVAEKCGAFWLLDEIALSKIHDHPGHKKLAAEEFTVWNLKVTGSTATLTVEDGNDNVVWSKEIEFTDFPLDEMTLWFTNNTILLPSEY